MSKPVNNSNPLKIVCLGAGYTNFNVVKGLRPLIRRGEVDVTVIDYNNFHVFHGLVAEMVNGKIQQNNITSPVRRLCAPARFHNATVLQVDFNRKEVVTSRSLDGREYTIPYDHLVVGLGTSDDLTRYSGIEENTFRLKAFSDCIQLRNHIPLMLELAAIESDPEERKCLTTFVIVGGNYAGVEIACELSEFIDDVLKKEFPSLKREDFSIVLLHSGDAILPELKQHYPKLARKAAMYVERFGIEIRLHSRLQSATPTAAITTNDETIATRTIVSCTGNTTSPMFKDWSLPCDKRGRLICDASGLVKGQETIWSGGDCAAVPMRTGSTAPPLALYAITVGKHIGKNIARLYHDKPLKDYRFTGLGDACCVGRRKAVGHIKGIQVSGFPAWLVWRIFMLTYLPLWDRRIRTLFDWCIWPFTGRDMASITDHNSLALDERYYEAGQDIVTEGDMGNAMYLVRSGEVVVIRKDEDGILATLGPGAHFGEIAVFERCHRTATVRAKSAVTLLEIKRNAAQKMKSLWD